MIYTVLMTTSNMTADQVATYIGKSRNTVDRLQRDGKLTPLPRTTSRGTRYFRKSDVDAFVAKRNADNPLKRPIVVRAIPTNYFIAVPANWDTMTTDARWESIANRFDAFVKAGK